ncbi:MAG: ammonium transporter [Candidatus Binatus sp.]|uniref:ammonium transporter n=1 Tax=Candidatus Binatus sp. TaxID=2811406 RepID=UPI0027257AF8|nr:ammonium transporter [Candidatus Binatus sp.]MDO8432525.1 ammonium transporter [Candidatus Binatus sp.]
MTLAKFRSRVNSVLLTTGGYLALASPAGAETTAAPTIDGADTAWLLVSSALVLMMTIPGLALFYGGLVRRKNVLSTLIQSFILVAVVSIQWVLFGYSLAFAPGTAIVGGLQWIGLMNVSAATPYADYSATVPHQAYMIYQCMFAVITPALITGAIAERMSFKGFLVFSILWVTFIYDPLAHWVWGVGGWIRQMGVLDFAGGTVVHISSGVAALAAALAIGPRRGYGHEPMRPHNLTMAVTGAGLLWVGWFGFNAGSSLAANGLAVSAFVATHLGAASATISWLAIEWWVGGRPTLLGAASGAVAGLVAITPASGYVGPMPAIVIGGAAGLLCFGAVRMKQRFHYDDALDVVGVHAIGGIWGALATGLFASVLVNSAGANGLFFGNPRLLMVQAIAVVATIVFSFVGSTVLLKVTDALVGIRVIDEDEEMGLDLSQHEESGYAFEG